MQLDQRTVGDAMIITVNEPRIDALCAIQFKEQMRILSADAPQRVLLDLGQVDFIDSSGLGAIVAALKQMNDGQSLELACLSETVQKVFRLTRMDSVFKIHADVPDLGSCDA
ncbi:STAS domain-containing protein [Nereida sp. MMG025]|uniref:STAS domain-containing protein n=1 Tax=Nereida sp. MMG025 TaxID=2909981 RepID=UPI001F27C991|nr:STAS domain-containing protein [Nereida sp. MMG025]MCF6444813.1 STAS domain-containing protein [Nereida sp. MMG025]